MTIQTYNDDFVYDDSRKIYIAKDWLKGQRPIDAAKKAGIYVGLTGTERYFDPLFDSKQLEQLLENLEPLFPNSHSRIPTIEEYETFMEWAKVNDRPAHQAEIDSLFAFLYEKNLGGYGFYFGDPNKLLSLEMCPNMFINNFKVREVIEKNK